jgi:ubiquinone/menaquinone biosynthesis C-methylase UbiE
MKDLWKAGDPYEQFMGRWSSLVAGEFLDWISPGHGLHWLDVGCGSGALSMAVMQRFKPENLTAIDQSQGFVLSAQKRLGARTICKVGSALELPMDDHCVDVTVSGLVLNFLPDINKALSEMTRVTKPAGLVAVYVWDYAGKMDFLQKFWESAAELNNEASHFDEAKRFADFNSDYIKMSFSKAGLDKIKSASLEIETHFTDFDDYWKPFLGGQGPAPTYLHSLSEAKKEQLKKLIHRRLPIQNNGSIKLTSRALAVKGKVKG